MCKVSSRNTRRGRADGARERRRQRRREGPADQCSSSSSSSSQTAHTQLLHPSAGVAPSPLSSPLTLPNAANAAAHATSVGFCITMPSPSSCAVQLVAAPWVRAAAAPLLLRAASYYSAAARAARPAITLLEQERFSLFRGRQTSDRGRSVFSADDSRYAPFFGSNTVFRSAKPLEAASQRT
jgi:hypothetical protein